MHAHPRGDRDGGAPARHDGRTAGRLVRAGRTPCARVVREALRPAARLGGRPSGGLRLAPVPALRRPEGTARREARGRDRRADAGLPGRRGDLRRGVAQHRPGRRGARLPHRGLGTRPAGELPRGPHGRPRRGARPRPRRRLRLLLARRQGRWQALPRLRQPQRRALPRLVRPRAHRARLEHGRAARHPGSP